VIWKIRNLDPELVVLIELVVTEATAAARPASSRHVWSFLESTAVAFKGNDTDERRVMEEEAGIKHGVAQSDSGWAWMAAAGFVKAAFWGEAMETAKSLLRKYDGVWELVPVSFCLLWRPARGDGAAFQYTCQS
jgi:hypothetical protein